MRGDEGNNRAGEMTGHKFFEMRLKGAETLGVGKMNACRLGTAVRCGDSPHPGFAKLASLAKRAARAIRA